MYHSFLIHQSADGHLGCFHVLAIINSAVVNIGVHVSLSDRFPLCVCPEVGLLGHMAVLFPVFSEISTLFSIAAVLICIPEGSLFSPPSLAFITYRRLDSSHPDWHVMVSHSGFDLHFSDNE